MKVLMKESLFTTEMTEFDNQLIIKASRFNQSESVPILDLGAPVVHTLRKLWCPFVCQGDFKKCHSVNAMNVFRGTSLASVDVDDLIVAAKKIPTNEPGRYIINLCLLTESVLAKIVQAVDLTSITPDRLVNIKARELMIYTPEYEKPNRHDSVALVTTNVATLEVILNSAYTGGELQIVCDGQLTDVKTGPFGWVAVHADASCTLSPVTSGARVSLIYDVCPAAEVGKPLLVQRGKVGVNFWNNIMNDVNFSDNTMDKLSTAAEVLNPDLKGKKIQHLDLFFLNARTVAKLATVASLDYMFPNKTLEIRPTHVAIHKSTHTEAVSHNYSEEREKGFLGTLVVVLGSFFMGGKVHVSRGSESVSIKGETCTWYAYAANSMHVLDPISNGMRVSLEYDIFDAGSAGPVHDPLAQHQDTATRTQVSAGLRADVQSAVLAALTETDVVLITLQYLYPDDVELSGLQGGDRALYDTLTSPTAKDNAGALFEVEFVNVTVQYTFDSALQKKVLAGGTYSYYADRTSGETDTPPLATTGSAAAAPTAPAARLIIPTKLTEQHRAATEGEEGKYCVSGLRVRVSQQK